jgi:uncharacterized membrane protein YbhN (UPF0104 family)
MQVTRSEFWRWVKIGLAVLIVGAVGWHFANILRRPELWQQPLRLNIPLLLLAMAAHVAAMLCWEGYWLRLVHGLGEKLSFLTGGRAYFVSQLGKYVPGKALAIVLRVDLARSAGVRTSVAAMTAIYEVLTSMAAGALVAAVLLPLLKSDQAELGWRAFGLLAVAGVPILPGVFNWLAARVARPFIPAGATPLPRLSISTLLGGLAQTAVGWFFLGASLVAVLWSLRLNAIELSWNSWLTCTAYVAVSYVAGFIALPTPGGLGVREAIMQPLLAREIAGRLGDEAELYSLIAVLVLRLVWTGSELGLAALFALANRLKVRA